MMTLVMKAIPQEAFPVAAMIEMMTMNYYPLVLLALIVLAVGNVVRTRFFGRVTITYPHGKTVKVASGTTILEASRIAKIPHQSVFIAKGFFAGLRGSWRVRRAAGTECA